MGDTPCPVLLDGHGEIRKIKKNLRKPIPPSVGPAVGGTFFDNQPPFHIVGLPDKPGNGFLEFGEILQVHAGQGQVVRFLHGPIGQGSRLQITILESEQVDFGKVAVEGKGGIEDLLELPTGGLKEPRGAPELLLTQPYIG